MKRLKPGVACATLAMALGFISGAGAQASLEPPEAASPETSGTMTGEPRKLSLRQVIRETLAQNLDIQIRDLDRTIGSSEITAQLGIYDPVFAAKVVRSRVDEQTTTLPPPEFPATKPDRDADGLVQEVDVTHSETSLEQKTPLGSIVALKFTDERQNYRDLRESTNTDPSYTETAKLGIVQPLLKNAGPTVTNAQIQIARRRDEQGGEAFRGEVMDRIADVMKAYWDLVFTIRDREVKQTSLEAARELLRVNKIKLEAGTVPPVDVYQAEAEEATREEDLIVSESLIIEAQDRLHRLMNWYDRTHPEAWDAPIVPTEEIGKSEPLGEDEGKMIAEAMEMRPDYRQARIDLEISEIERTVASWQRLPELNAFADYGFSGLNDSRSNANEDMRDGHYTDYNVGLEFKFPILNRTAAARFSQSLDRVKKGELRLDSLELQIVAEIRRAARDWRTTVKRIDAAGKGVTANDEKVKSERKRLEVGQSTTFNVLDFQSDLSQAQTDDVRARVEWVKATIELERSRGTLLAAQGIIIEPPKERE